jgi:hypothetical protein
MILCSLMYRASVWHGWSTPPMSKCSPANRVCQKRWARPAVTTSSSAWIAALPPSLMRRLQPNSRLGETPCSRATVQTVIPGCLWEAVLRTLDQLELLHCTVAAAAFVAGDDRDARWVVRQRRMSRFPPQPSGLCPCLVEVTATPVGRLL